MIVLKGVKSSAFPLVDIKPSILRKQFILIGALLITTVSSIGMGYAVYTLSPLAQEYFLKLTGFG